MKCDPALSWRRNWPFLLTNAGCRHWSYQCISWICWAYFSDVMFSWGFRKLWCIRQAADHQTMTMTLFWCKFSFGASSQSSHWASPHWLSYKIHFSSHITIRSRNGLLLLHRITEDDTLKWWFFVFDLRLAHEASTYQAFSPFQFTSNAKQP